MLHHKETFFMCSLWFLPYRLRQEGGHHREKCACQASLPLSLLCLTKDIKELLSGIVFDNQVHSTQAKFNEVNIFGFLATN